MLGIHDVRENLLEMNQLQQQAGRQFLINAHVICDVQKKIISRWFTRRRQSRVISKIIISVLYTGPIKNGNGSDKRQSLDVGEGKSSLRHVFCYQSLTDDIEQNMFGQPGPTFRQMEGDDVDLNRNRKS